MTRIRLCAPGRRKLHWLVTMAVVAALYYTGQNLHQGKIVFVTNVSSRTTDASTGQRESIHKVSTSSVTTLASRVSRHAMRPVNGERTGAEQTIAAGHARNPLTTNGRMPIPTVEQLTEETSGGIPSIVAKHMDKAAADRNSESNYSTLFDLDVGQNPFYSVRDNAWQYAITPNKRSMPPPPAVRPGARANLLNSVTRVRHRTNIPNTVAEAGHGRNLINTTAESRRGSNLAKLTLKYGHGTNITNRNFEVHHIFFLKVHKAASTTVMNMMYRYALSRNLSVMLPRKGNFFSQSSKNWGSNIMPEPPRSRHFDILCNHLVFSPELVERALPADAKYIAIVRHPLQQTISAFYYYRLVFPVPYLTAIPGKDPLATYLADPGKWDARDAGRSFTMNRMSFDFGLDPKGFHDKEYLEAALAYLNKTFDLVMVSERFDESAVLLRRVLGWRWKDILYATNNALPTKHRHPHNVTAQEMRNHRLHNAADYALYEYFSDLFEQRVIAQGDDFVKEVAAFQETLLRVDAHCENGSHSVLQAAATLWDDGFSVSSTDCSFMKMKELSFVELVRKVQAFRNRSYYQRRMFVAPTGPKLHKN